MAARREQSAPGTALAELEQLDRTTHNVLMPIASLEGDAVSEHLVASISLITIDPDPARGLVYHDPVYAPQNKGKAALTGMGLAKIAAAAGIQWEGSEVEMRERRPDGHVYVRIRVTGAVRQPNGELYRISAAKHLDTQDWSEQRAAQYARRTGSTAMSPAEIQKAVARDVLQFRAFVDERAETGAQNRVIRKLLTLPGVLTLQELRRPFAVPRLLYRPATALALEEGSRASDQLYGGGAAGIQAAPSADAAAERSQSSPEGRGPRGQRSERGAPRAAQPEPAEDSPPLTAAEDPAAPAGGDLEDMRVADHGNDLMSEIARTDPQYLRDLALRSSGAPSKTRALAEAHLARIHPTLEGTAE